MKILANLAVATFFAVVSAGAQSEDAPGGAAGEKFRDCDACPEMVVVPAGEFMMGSPSSEEGRQHWEGPVRRVRIGKFAVGVYEVTRREFARFAEETGYSAGDSCRIFDRKTRAVEREGGSWRRPGYAQTGRDPVVCVSWEDAGAYVEWLSGKTGKGYRLLSESEWEYVARAGASTARYWGERETDQCRYENGADADLILGVKHLDSIAADAVSCADGHAYTSPVGNYAANGFGLYDVLGNVLEWTQDCWNWSYEGAPSDGSAWEEGDCGLRVLRGGSWVGIPRILRSANRFSSTAGYRYSPVGFRVARTLTP